MEDLKLVWPTFDRGAPITQRFGENAPTYRMFGQKGHNGLDIGILEGTAVLAMADGVIRFAGNGVDEVVMGASAGTCILVASESFLTGYAHLSRLYAQEGDLVKAGDVIALSGNTGASSGQHLHAELIPLPLALGNGYLGRADLMPYMEGSTEGPIEGASIEGVDIDE